MEKFDGFYRVNRTYHVVNGHNIDTTVFVPETVSNGSECPVIVHFHGGSFMFGHRLYEDWFAPWIIQLALVKQAIIISPDYRLLPEASGQDLLNDIQNFWQWLRNDLTQETPFWKDIPIKFSIDLSRIAVHGESSGGWLAVHSCLATASTPPIRCVITSCAPLDITLPQFSIPQPRYILGQPPLPPRQAERIIRQYLQSFTPGTVRTAGDPTQMWELMVSMLQQGYCARFLGKIERGSYELDIIKALDINTRPFPPIWVIHGLDDSVVPVLCANNFVKKLQQVQKDSPILMSLLPGDHGFDLKSNIDEDWVREGCLFISNYWP